MRTCSLISKPYRIVSNYRTTVYSDAQARRENCVNIQRYRKTVAEVPGTWCTKNDARALSPVGARSFKMAVQKTSIFGEVYLFSDTVIYAFSEAVRGHLT